MTTTTSDPRRQTAAGAPHPAAPQPPGVLDTSTYRALAIAFGSHAHRTASVAAVLNDFCRIDLGVSGLCWHDRAADEQYSYGAAAGIEHRFALHDASGHGHLADLAVYHPELLTGARLQRLEEVIAIVTVTLSARAGQPVAPVRAPSDALIAIRIDNFDRLLARGGIAAGRRAADRICEVVGMISGKPSADDQLRVACDGLLELHVRGNTAAALDLAERIRTVMAAQPLRPGEPPLTVSVLVAVGVRDTSRAALRATRNAVVCA